jgi:hypothetical protein
MGMQERVNARQELTRRIEEGRERPQVERPTEEEKVPATSLGGRKVALFAGRDAGVRVTGYRVARRLRHSIELRQRERCPAYHRGACLAHEAAWSMELANGDCRVWIGGWQVGVASGGRSVSRADRSA